LTHTSFPFTCIRKSVTVNDRERRNGRYSAYLTEFGSFGANYVKVTEMWPKESSVRQYTTHRHILTD